MKNVMICLLILVIIFGGVGGYIYYQKYAEEKRVEEVKKGWYVEILEDYINVRSDSNSNAKKLGQVNKGEVYKVLEVNLDNSAYFWYKIEYKNEDSAWIASYRTKPWVNDVNNPTDIAVPIIKFYEDTYKVVSIDDINYKHLEVIEDSVDYEITHIIYHELVPSQNKDQYWILYTITDGAGKSSSKLQRIEFEEIPDESEVVDFSKYNG